MEIGQLYQFVLLIVLVGMLLGVGVLILDSFRAAVVATSGFANHTLNDTVRALLPVATTWLPLVITISVLAIILTLVIRSFASRGR